MLKKLMGTMRFLYAYVGLVRDPNRLDLVFALADKVTTTKEPLPLFYKPEVTAFLRRPDAGLDIDLEVLGELPAGTLGRELAEWLQSKGFTPDALDRGQTGDERARVRRHIERTHDIWHLVTGFETDVAGELGLQAFYQAQLDSPVPLILFSTAFLNALLRERADTARRMDAVTRGWALGKESKPLFGTDWAALWDVPLDEVRRRFGMDPSMFAGADREQDAGAPLQQTAC